MGVQQKKNIREQDRLRAFNYENRAPLLELSSALTFEQKGVYFHAVDGSFWRIWLLDGFDYDVISPGDRRAVSDAFAKVLDNFPEGSSGQLISTTHGDIRNEIGALVEYQSDNPFSGTLLNAIMERQIMGSREGFFAKLNRRQIEASQQEVVDSFSDEEDRAAAYENIERELSVGRYAHAQQLLLCFRHTPPWFAEENKPVASIAESVLSAVGLYDIRKAVRKKYVAELQKFTAAASRIEQALSQSNFFPAKMTGQGLVDWMYREFNPNRNFLSAPPIYKANETLREQIKIDPVSVREHSREIPGISMFTDIETHKDGWTIDGVHYAAVSLVQMPRKTRPGMLFEALSQFEGEGHAVINFYVNKQRKTRLRATIRRQVNKSKESAKNIPFVPYDEEKAAEDEYDVSQVLSATNPESQGRSSAIDVSIHVIFKDRDREALVDRARSAEIALWELGYHERDRGDAFIHYCMPMNFRRAGQKMLARWQTVLSEYVADVSPIFRGYNGCSNSPTSVLLNNRRGTPVMIDIFGQHVVAGHSIVIGGTGSGKSFAVNNLNQQIQSRSDTKFVIIDRGGSYLSSCEAQNGQYLDLAFDETEGVKPVCINPFYIPPVSKRLEDGTEVFSVREPLKYEVSFMVSVLRAMMRTGSGNGVEVTLTKTDVANARDALNACFADRKEPDDEVILDDWCTKVVEMYGDEGKRLVDNLSEYTNKRGYYGRLFDGKLEVDWNNPLIVTETDKIADTEAMPVAMMCLFHQINTYFKYKLPTSVKKVLAIDEAWAALAHPDVATAVSGYILEMRKYGAAIMLISQSLEHFKSVQIASRSGDGGSSANLLGNIKHFFLLSCSHTDHQIGRELLNMTDDEIASWTGVSSLPPFYSEIFYRYISKQDVPISGRVRLYSNPVSYWLSTTDANDKPMRARRVEQLLETSSGMSDTEARVRAVTELAREFPYGSAFEVQQNEDD